MGFGVQGLGVGVPGSGSLTSETQLSLDLSVHCEQVGFGVHIASHVRHTASFCGRTRVRIDICRRKGAALGFKWSKGRRFGLGKVDMRLPGKGYSNSHGARPVHQIIMINDHKVDSGQ